MDEELEEGVLSFLRGQEGWKEEYSSISEFKQHLNESDLVDKSRWDGFGRENEQQLNNTTHLQPKITTLFENLSSSFLFFDFNYYMVQFWSVVKVEGRRHYLSTSHHPFFVSHLLKGYCRYRKLCMDHVYPVEVDGSVEESQLGGVGRAYRNEHPESTPDLRLYSTNEFPLRDHAARCGFRFYLALPLFHLHTNECYGVLELLSNRAGMDGKQISLLYQALQSAGLKSPHINFNPISYLKDEMPDKYKQQVNTEIRELLETVIQALPRLSLAQVWVYCKQCVNFCCMERAYFIAAPSKKINSCNDIDRDMFDYLQACELHHLQLDRNHFHQNLWDRSISNSPLEHYAQRGRLSHHFAICMQSVDNSNDTFVIEFFLQPECSSLHLLSRIIQMKLKSFTFEWEGQLLEIFESSVPNEIECESIDMLEVMNSYEEKLSESNFKEYMDSIDDSCCLRPPSVDSQEGWVFSCPSRERLCENCVNSNTVFVPLLMKERIEEFMKKMAIEYGRRNYWIVQFWAPKMAEGRCYLETSAQPYAVGCLAKGLASFRKESMKHHYFVDDEAKEEEFGPAARVFRNGHPELFHDPFFYSAKEFSMRSYALHCGLKNYFVLPVFDEHDEFNKHECVGVLEFLGFCCSDEKYGLRDIIRALRAVKLRSTQIHSHPTLIKANIHDCKVEAMNEINAVLFLFRMTPQCQTANVWVCNGKCMGSKSWCMKWVASTGLEPTLIDKRIHVEPRMGIIGMVLESESKSCFCRNICEFSIADQPLAYHERAERRQACFAICLQSSRTGDLLYVLEFFLYQSPATCEYLRSFYLHILLPTMKHRLKSFKIASGKQLGEELVVEVIEFSEANQLISSESNQLDVFPIKFKSVLYGQKEHQHIEEQMVRSNPKFTQIKQCSVVISNFSKTEKGKRKTGLHLSLEVLKPHFGKKLEDVAEELGIGRSTIKRACRDYGINRWPGNEKQARNLSLFERASTQDHHQDMQPSSSNNLQVSDVPKRNTESTQLPAVQGETEKVMIKVKHQGDIIRFELRRSLGVVKLSKEVARRLNLEVGTFKLKYMDEDNEEILIACDEDLQLCPKSVTSMGKTCVQLFIPK